MNNIKVALVCDWLTGIGGAERVVLELHKMFPDAPIYTSQYDPGRIDWFAGADVRTTWLQKLPSALKKFLPVLRAWSFSRLNLSEYDLVISTGGAEAKFIKTSPNKHSRFSQLFGAQGANEERKGNVHVSTTSAHRSLQHSDPDKSIGGVIGSADEQANTVRKCVHVYYCYAPVHYYWSRYDEYMQNPGFGAFNWLARMGLKMLVGPMRRWDYKAAQRPDFIIGISSHIQKEIKKYYGRKAALIHPPVDTSRFQKAKSPQPSVLSPPLSPRHGFVTAGRQAPYKRHDLAVAACTKLNLPLTVIGNGPEHDKLVKMAGPTVKFVTNASDADVARYFVEAEAFIFPGLDDFGIVAVEAMASGTPVIAFRSGGAIDYVIPGKTGEFFIEQTVESLVQTLKTFNSDDFNREDIVANSKAFSSDKFQSNMREFLSNTLSHLS